MRDQAPFAILRKLIGSWVDMEQLYQPLNLTQIFKE